MTLLSDQRSRFRLAAPSRSLRLLPLVTLVVDLVVIAAVIGVAVFGRRHLALFDRPADLVGDLTMIGPLMIIGWLATLAMSGAYHRNIFGAGTEELRRVVSASLLAAGLVGVVCYLSRFGLSRGFFVLAFGVGLPALILARLVLRHVLHSARRRGALRHRVVIAGSRSHVDEVAAVLQRETWLGYQVVGALTPPHELDEETALGVPVLGNTEDATSVVVDSGADLIFFAGGALTSAQHMRRMVWDLEKHDVQVVVAPSVSDISSERVRVRPVGGLPLMHIDPPRWSDASRWGKRLFDILGSLALIVAFSPIFLIAAIEIRRHDGSPILFRQIRIGRDGAAFECLKFRTMVTDAEALLARLHAEQGHQDGLFKMRDDPRITRPGRWLRRMSFDELPQLFNVLRGDMSLVGPRPPLPLEVERYEGDTVRRLHVRPGMTGLWQVSGRSDLSWSEAIRLDLYYVDNWSMLQDLSILLKTFRAVLGARGAY